MNSEKRRRARTDGEALRLVRLAKRLSQDEIGRLVGLSRGAISSYERGKHRMNAETRSRLLAALAGDPEPPESA